MSPTILKFSLSICAVIFADLALAETVSCRPEQAADAGYFIEFDRKGVNQEMAITITRGSGGWSAPEPMRFQMLAEQERNGGSCSVRIQTQAGGTSFSLGSDLKGQVDKLEGNTTSNLVNKITCPNAREFYNSVCAPDEAKRRKRFGRRA